MSTPDVAPEQNCIGHLFLFCELHPFTQLVTVVFNTKSLFTDNDGSGLPLPIWGGRENEAHPDERLASRQNSNSTTTAASLAPESRSVGRGKETPSVYGL